MTKDLDRATTETADVDFKMEDGRPASDPLAMDRARARAELALFGHAEPARLDRYVVLEPIASGGMGMVFSAYDPKLDRRVAMKIVHPGRAGDTHRERLLMEARALAKLDHPNVVKVFDVLTVEDQLVIVMELVEGETLQDWEARAPRSTREILRVYACAGEALMAAHSVDVVHRDFKPANVVVGRDGRVRVLDFGLAWLSRDEPTVELRTSSDVRKRLTQTGTFLGTLGYSSPEQLRGQTVTAASDLFSFCVALHHAVEGVPPYRGESVAARLENIASGEVAIGRHRSVPGWLRRELATGLSESPAERHASMAPLLRSLTRNRGWRRWQLPVSAGLALTLSVVVAVMLQRDHPTAPVCTGGVDAARTTWNPAERDAVVHHLAHIGSESLGAAVTERLDRQVESWQRVHRTVCLRARRGEQSTTLLDRAMVCLEAQLAEIGASVAAVRAIGAEQATRALAVVTTTPADRCGDLAILAAEVDPPADPETAAKVKRARATIRIASVEERAGQPTVATETARRARIEAEGSGYQPVIAEAALNEGRILLRQQDLAQAYQPLRDAERLGLALDLRSLVVEATARRLYVDGMRDGAAYVPAMTELLEHVEASARQLSPTDPAYALLLNNAGAVYALVGDLPEARRYFERAIDATARVGSDVELTAAAENLALITDDATARESLMRSALTVRQALLGRTHPWSLETLTRLAQVTNDPEVSYRSHVEVCDARARSGFDTVGVVVCEINAGLLAWLRDDEAAARARLSTAVATPLTEQPSKLGAQLETARAVLELLDDKLALAIATAGAVRSLPVSSWRDARFAHAAELITGLAELERDRSAAAAAMLERAAVGFAEIGKSSYDVVYQLGQQQARNHLDKARAREHQGL